MTNDNDRLHEWIEGTIKNLQRVRSSANTANKETLLNSIRSNYAILGVLERIGTGNAKLIGAKPVKKPGSR